MRLERSNCSVIQSADQRLSKRNTVLILNAAMFWLHEKMHQRSDKKIPTTEM